MTLILIGFKGVGKTTFGRKVAHRLDWPFIDGDDLIKEKYSQTHPLKEVPAIYQELKEEAFRELEYRSLKELKISCPSILAVGGGAILNSKTAQLLKKTGTLVYLAKSKERILKDLKKGRVPNTLIANDLEASFEIMYQQRLPLYEKWANAVIDTDLSSEEQIIDALYQIAQSS